MEKMHRRLKKNFSKDLDVQGIWLGDEIDKVMGE
jgi:hypothetical protein